MAPSLVRKDATPSDAHRTPLLDNFSIAFFQEEEGFIARQVFPTIGGESTGKYYKITTPKTNEAKLRAPGTEAEEGAWDLEQLEYGCKQYGYKEKIPEELISATGPSAKADEVSTRSVAEVLAINEETRFVDTYMKTGVWSRDVAGAAADAAATYIYWSTSATSKPVKNILTERLGIKQRSRRFPNVLVLGAELEPILLEHPDIIGKLNNGQTPGGPAMASLADLAKVFRVEKVIVASAVAGADDAFIFPSKSAWLGFANPTPSKMTPSAGYRFTDQDLAGNSDGIRNWRYWDQPRRSWFIETAVDDEFKVVSTECGVWLGNMIQ